MSAHSGALEAVERVLNRGGEADDVLRQVVATLHERLGRYVRISFVEADRLVSRPGRRRRGSDDGVPDRLSGTAASPTSR